MANLKERWQAAVGVLRYGYPWEIKRAKDLAILRERKGAPFMIWPEYYKDNPQWRMIDLQGYIDEGFNMNTLIYSAVMFKGRAAIQAPLRAYRGDEHEPEKLEEDHPLAKLCFRPNPSQSWREFQLAQTIFLNIAGEAFTWLNRKDAEMGVPSEMHPLNPRRMYIIPGEKRGEIKGYVYVPEGKAIKDGTPIISEDVSHVKLPNPGDDLDGYGYGLSPISSLAQSGDVDNMVTKFLNLFFKKGAVPVGTLQFERALDDGTVGEIKERWRELYGGYENWSDIGVIDSGGEYQRIGMTFEELGFGALDQRNESRILGPFGVPPILIGSRLGLERATYANYKEARQGFWEDTMRPEMLLHEDDYKYYLRSDDGAKVGFDFTEAPALRKDLSMLVEAWQGLVEYGVPKSQAAKVVGLTLGELEDGGVSYMPLNMAAVSNGKKNAAQVPLNMAAVKSFNGFSHGLGNGNHEEIKDTKESDGLGELVSELRRANDLLEKTAVGV